MDKHKLIGVRIAENAIPHLILLDHYHVSVDIPFEILNHPILLSVYTFIGIFGVLVGKKLQWVHNIWYDKGYLGRKDNKFKEYLFTKGGVKFPSFKNIDLQPIRTMFRTYNPEKIL